MKRFAWEAAKNEWLKVERQISFEDVIVTIYAGGLLDTTAHPSRERYPNQQILVVNIGGYVYLVPVVETAEEIFLKTIIPSRKATKFYLGGKKNG